MPVVAAPALIAVAAALLALLLLYGMKFFVQAVAGLIPKGLPVIGDFLHNAVLAAGAAVMAAIQWIMADVIRPVVNFVLSPVFAVLNWLLNLERAVGIMADELVWLVASGIPQLATDLRHLVARVHDLLHNRITAVRDYLVRHIAHVVAVSAAALGARILDVRHLAAAGIAGARALAHNLHDNLQAWAVRAIAASTAGLHAAIHQVRVDLTGAIDGVRATVKTELSTAEHYADTAVSDAIKAMTHATSVAVAGVIQTVDVDSVAALAAAWPGIIDLADELEGVIATDLPDIGAAVRAIPRAIPRDLADALAIVGTISIPMLRYMTRCGIPNCRNLSSLGRELANLLDDLAGGAFLALLVALAADPQGTARFLHDNVSPIAEDAIGAARSLIGV